MLKHDQDWLIIAYVGVRHNGIGWGNSWAQLVKIDNCFCFFFFENVSFVFSILFSLFFENKKYFLKTITKQLLTFIFLGILGSLETSEWKAAIEQEHNAY